MLPAFFMPEVYDEEEEVRGALITLGKKYGLRIHYYYIDFPQ